jgi:3-oxoacyl-[acyl-carrier-protein] synthase II
VTRIAVTGLAAIGPNARTAEELWRSCLAGASGIARLRGFDTTGLAVDFGGALPEWDLAPWVSRRDELRYDPSQVVATAVAGAALADAGDHPYAAERLGAAIGTGAGAVHAHAAAALAEQGGGPTAVSAYYPAAGSTSLAASLPAMRLGLRGPVLGVNGACATAAHNIIVAAQLLAAGDADLMLAGAVDVMLSRAAIAGFANMRALARHPVPAKASRPLDQDRNGIVLSDGAAVLVLERLDDAKARGARTRAVLRGYGMTSDAGSILAPDAEGIERAVRIALARAELEPTAIDHVNLHAAGTRDGDAAEARALHEALGTRAARIPVTAPKSALGHAMGAAAGLETVVAVRTLETGFVPPTINLDQIDPEIALSASATAQPAAIRFVLKTSSGLGGLNAALVLEAAVAAAAH